MIYFIIKYFQLISVTDEESQFRALQRQVGELAPAIGQLYKRIVTEKQLGREWSEVTREIANISSSGIKARTHVGKLKDSWQHLLRDRASRTLTYNDEQFHILEKIKMQETIRVLQDLLQKECTPSINQMTDALADWYKMAQTTFLQTEILMKDIMIYKNDIESFIVTLKQAQIEKYHEALNDGKTSLSEQRKEQKEQIRKRRQQEEEEKRIQQEKIQQVEAEQQVSVNKQQLVKNKKGATVGESKQVRKALRSILTTQDEVWGILRENTRLIEQFGQLAVAASSVNSSSVTPNGSNNSLETSSNVLAELENASAATAVLLANKNY